MFDNHDRVKFNNNNIVTEGKKKKDGAAPVTAV